MNNNELTPEMESLKTRLRSVWIAGDFGRIAETLTEGAQEFVDRLNLRAGQKVLDVACGTGNLALPAARLGAEVTGIDIAPNLIEQARTNAESENLPIRFDVGDAESLPYEDASFDCVITMFGAMFAPRPDVTAAELKRVCRPGGLIAMANWTPAGFTGQMFKLGAKHLPPPPNMPPPVLWGDAEAVRARFGEGVADLKMTPRQIVFKFPFSPAEVVEHFRIYFGPTKTAFASLDADAQAALRRDLEALWTENNQAKGGATEVESEYLEIIAVRG